jgi:hypothetical protein
MPAGEIAGAQARRQGRSPVGLDVLMKLDAA